MLSHCRDEVLRGFFGCVLLSNYVRYLWEHIKQFLLKAAKTCNYTKVTLFDIHIYIYETNLFGQHIFFPRKHCQSQFSETVHCILLR